MRTIILFFHLIIITLLVSCSSSSDKYPIITDLEKEGIRDHVTLINEEYYAIWKDLEILDSYNRTIYKNGFIQEYTGSRIVDKNDMKIVYEYDKKNRKTKTTRFDIGETTWLIFYSYNLKGLLKKETFTRPKFSSEKEYTTYEYDRKGNMIKMTMADSEGKDVETYKYNEKNELIEEIDSDGGITKYWYSDGRKVEEQRFFSDGSFSFKKIYKYNEYGYIIEENSFNYKGVNTLMQYLYIIDPLGNWIEKIIFSDGQNTGKWKRHIVY